MQSSDLDSLRALARDFLRRELLPCVERCDESEAFPLEIYRKLVDTGLTAVPFSEDFGGAESLRGLAILAEEMARIDPGFGLSVLATIQLFAYNVYSLGTDAQKKRYLHSILLEKKLAGWALTEPDVGSNAIGIRTTGRRSGDGYRLNGTKTFVTNAPIADYFIVVAREYGEGIDGGKAFIVERGTQGLEIGQPLKKMGHRTSPTGQIFLRDCLVPLSSVLGQPGRAFYDMKRSLDLERVIFAALPLGLMKECLQKAKIYAVERSQFGQSIGSYQLIQEMLADVAVRVELVDCYLDRCLTKVEAGECVTYEAAVLKYFAADEAVCVADRALQILGGNGYMREFPIEKLFRDARLYPIGGGTSQINKLVVAKEIFKREF